MNNNTVEFIVKMRDLMSSGLGRLSSTSATAFGRMSKSADGATSRNHILSMSFKELTIKIKEVEDKIKNSTIPSQISAARRELAALQRQTLNHPGNIGGGGSSRTPRAASTGGISDIALGSMLGGYAMQAGNAIVSAVGSGVSTMITKSMEKEQAITGLTTFLGKQGAQEAYKNIRQDADVTPFDTESLLMVNRSLISAGANAKDARTDTLNLANAVSAVGGGNDILSRMAANMQQVKTVGKATAMDIKQFGMAGINIYAMLSRSTGKSIDQVKEMDVTYEDLSKTLAMANSKGGIYEGAMAAQSQTKFGKWSTVKDKFSNAASDIGDAFDPVFHRLLDLAISFADNVPAMLERAKPFIDGIATVINGIVDFIQDINSGSSEWSGWVQRIRDHFMVFKAIVQHIGITLWGFVSSIVEFVKNSEILKDIFSYISTAILTVWSAISKILDLIVWMWENVVKPILEAIDRAYKWIKGVDDVEIKTTKKLVVPKPKDDDPSPLGSGASMMQSNSSSGKAAGESVVGGGPKVVNITIGKFFDNIQFTTLNNQETSQELENMVLECLTRVVYNGSKTV
ncbi:hypothetical protein [Flavobacterium sp. '19STA2R22 D10 B1']|uniref:hypothetical protein n=1 Tax=Flavobacterium aerium TaxID=3037261 RepID=UPI00278C2463|nr:hypothetical protein [Flavobacterium sp. '19STA2R22 D10 B1']